MKMRAIRKNKCLIFVLIILTIGIAPDFIKSFDREERQPRSPEQILLEADRRLRESEKRLESMSESEREQYESEREQYNRGVAEIGRYEDWKAEKMLEYYYQQQGR